MLIVHDHMVQWNSYQCGGCEPKCEAFFALLVEGACIASTDLVLLNGIVEGEFPRRYSEKI